MALMALMAGTLSWLSVARYLGYNAGMLDLGNMAQAIGSVLRGQPLVYTETGGPFSRLAKHVEIIYFPIAALYALWPDPRLLLILQACGYALGAIPAYRLAARRLPAAPATPNRPTISPALLVAAIYLLYPVALTAVLFDFHGDTLAMPLLLGALDALDERAWRRYGALIALALLCKVYVAVAVVGLGLVAYRWYGARRAGAITAVAGAAYGLMAFGVLRALFASHSAAPPETNYLTFYFSDLSQIAASAVERALTALVVFLPALLLLGWRGWRSLLPALPIACAALITTGPGGGYDYRYHHYALAVPFLIAALVEGAALAARQSQTAGGRRARPWRTDLAVTLLLTLIFSGALVNWPLNPQFWTGAPGYGLDPSVYGRTARDTVKDAVLATIPGDAPIAASTFLAPHLANRATLFLTRYGDEPDAARLAGNAARVEYVITDALFDWYTALDGGYGGGLDYERDATARMLRDPQFQLTTMRDGLLIFQRGAPHRLDAAIDIVGDDGRRALERYGSIELVDVSLVPASDGVLRASFTWRRTGPLAAGAVPMAVSDIEGVTQTRFVHLPSFALLTPDSWPVGKLVRERFDVTLPANMTAGTYRWRTGWYAPSSPSALFTDERSSVTGAAAPTVASFTVR